MVSLAGPKTPRECGNLLRQNALIRGSHKIYSLSLWNSPFKQRWADRTAVRSSLTQKSHFHTGQCVLRKIEVSGQGERSSRHPSWNGFAQSQRKQRQTDRLAARSALAEEESFLPQVSMPQVEYKPLCFNPWLHISSSQWAHHNT